MYTWSQKRLQVFLNDYFGKLSIIESKANQTSRVHVIKSVDENWRKFYGEFLNNVV